MRTRISLRRITPVLLCAVLVLFGATPAMAYAPVDIVHTERVQTGPYMVTVGFSKWPLRAMQSLDFTFMPDGGIAGKSGSLVIKGPSTRGKGGSSPLVRHPRKRDTWGLDTVALNTPGTYSFGFAIDGSLGTGDGTLTGVTVLDQPGPPLPLSWAVGTLPLGVLVVFLVFAWRRTRPGRRQLVI
jgi:hypothetical protein